MRASSLPLSSLLALALGLLPAAAAASPVDARAHVELLDRFVEGERARIVARDTIVSRFVPVPRAPWVPRTTSALDCVHATHDIAIDPGTGKTDATLELRVRAVGKALGSVSFTFDAGLEPGTVTASGGHEVAVAQDTFSGTRVVRVDLAPALAPDEEAIVKVPYAGTLACGRSSTAGTVCSKSTDFAYLAQHSIFPFIYDTEAPESAVFDGLTRDIVLRVPAAHDVVATGQKVAESVEGRTKVARWSIDRPLSRTVGVYAFVGRLGKKTVSGRPVPTTFFFPPPSSAVDDELVSWSSPALDFIERSSGARLPFEKNLSLVRLPQEIGDPGTATWGMTLLSDSYAKTGDLMYEETWAHENAHLFWGIVMPELDANESRLMSEGMATLTQIEYSHGRHFRDEDRDLYLARRFAPMGIDVRVTGKDLPAPALLAGTQLPADLRTRRYTMWAYYRTAITLDHLRVTVGEDVFGRALATYKSRCSFKGCRPGDLRTVLEEETGKDLSPFFERWVTGKERPHVSLGFVPTTRGVEIEATKEDDRPLTLELWLGRADGSRVKRLVDLGPKTTRAMLDVDGGPVVRVGANPRHDVLVDVRSAIEGDLDFDGESDGFDILRCARLVGTSYDARPASGLWAARETFDARCDVNEDLTIDDRDLEALASSFGTLRSR